MKILFSGVGSSDPTPLLKEKDDEAKIEPVNEGGLLHICRQYKPDIVYIYYTHDMYELKELDNRYVNTLRLLEKEIDHKFEIVEKTGKLIQDAHHFDAFFDEFDTIIDEIIDKHGTDIELLLNVSSGTPAMKATMQILAVLSTYNVIPVQVEAPSNSVEELMKRLRKYDYQKAYELNLNQIDPNDNRSYTSVYEKFRYKVQKELIFKALDSYDYEAAYTIANSMKHHMNQSTFELLEFAKDRYHLNSIKYMKLQKKLKENEILTENLTPYTKDEERILFEYAIWLYIKCKRGDYLDFCRGINPFMFEASYRYILRNKKINMFTYTEGHKQIVKKSLLERDENGKEIQNILDDYYQNKDGFKEVYLTEDQMIVLIEHWYNDKKISKYFCELNDFRKKMRNVASHKITAVDEDVIQNEMKNNVDYYLKQIKGILSEMGFDIKKHWDCYDEMNCIIKGQLEKGGN